MRVCRCRAHQKPPEPSQDPFPSEVAANPAKIASCSQPLGRPHAPTARFHTTKTLRSVGVVIGKRDWRIGSADPTSIFQVHQADYGSQGKHSRWRFGACSSHPTPLPTPWKATTAAGGLTIIFASHRIGIGVFPGWSPPQYFSKLVDESIGDWPGTIGRLSLRPTRK